MKLNILDLRSITHFEKYKCAENNIIILIKGSTTDFLISYSNFDHINKPFIRPHQFFIKHYQLL